MKEKLTSKQKKFALEFLISGNITDAAKKAGYSERSARQIGSLNLTKPNVVEYMNEILEKTKSEEVATTEEVLEFLTSVMRGNVAEQFGLDPAITDRTKRFVNLRYTSCIRIKFFISTSNTRRFQFVLSCL